MLGQSSGIWNTGRGCWVERGSYSGTGTILSTLLWGRYCHAHCTDKVMETQNDLVCCTRAKIFIWRNWLWCQASGIQKPWSCTVPATSPQWMKRGKGVKRHCGTCYLGPLLAQYLVSPFSLLAEPQILFWKALWKYSLPHTLGDQFWWRTSKQETYWVCFP